jgi:Fatty acid hydroxylase superfamily
MINFTQHVIVSAAISYPILSLVEYLVHRHIMHSPRLARALKSKYIWETFWEHAATHHRQCYDVFDHDDRPCTAVNITVKPTTSLLIATVPCVIVLTVDPLTSIVLLMGAMINGAVWSRVHAEMHRPTTAWICQLTLFKYLRRLHFLHHRHPRHNFNTLCPMWDWILGTTARETAADLAEMEKQTWRIRSNSTWYGRTR